MRDALIIGAGFSGLYQLHLLRDRLRMDALVLEQAEGVGGTWWWNRYPGARCDSESHCYQYMFSEALSATWEWSERYPGHAEIRRYLDHVAEHLDLKRDIRFGTRVTAAEWDAGACCWRVRTATGEAHAARFLITAVGCLSAANLPRIEGLEEFAGRRFHTGEWPHEPVSFAGRRVGQIGTGSTGIQAAPVIAAEAAHLTLFQRTPNYSTPARNRPLTPEFKRWARASFAALRQTMRETTNGFPYRITDRSVMDLDAGERERVFEAQWEQGGLQFRAAFRDIVLNADSNREAAEFIRRKIRAIVQDPATADLLTAMDHPYAAKRPPIDSDYFEIFNRPNVTLVDIRANPIARIMQRGVLLEDGTAHEVDDLVLATGFDAMTGPLFRLGIAAGGRTLREAWAAGPHTHLGLMVPGFPNLFTVTGPGSPSVLTNMPAAIEQHVEWIADLLAHLRGTGAATIEAEAAAATDWAERVREAAAATLFPQAHSSWYLGANIPGKPRVFMPYSGGLNRYRAVCDEIAARGYPGFAIGRAAAGAGAAAAAAAAE